MPVPQLSENLLGLVEHFLLNVTLRHAETGADRRFSLRVLVQNRGVFATRDIVTTGLEIRPGKKKLYLRLLLGRHLTGLGIAHEPQTKHLLGTRQARLARGIDLRPGGEKEHTCWQLPVTLVE